jgi:hypothetical protein
MPTHTDRFIKLSNILAVEIENITEVNSLYINEAN